MGGQDFQDLDLAPAPGELAFGLYKPLFELVREVGQLDDLVDHPVCGLEFRQLGGDQVEDLLLVGRILGRLIFFGFSLRFLPLYIKYNPIYPKMSIWGYIYV